MSAGIRSIIAVSAVLLFLSLRLLALFRLDRLLLLHIAGGSHLASLAPAESRERL